MADESTLALCWSPDGSAIAAGGQADTVQVWDVATGTIRRSITGYRRGVVALAWSPDGDRIASAGLAGRVRLVDSATGKLDRSFTGHGTTCWTVGWSPDGTRIAAAGRSGEVIVWNLATGLGPRFRVTYYSPGVRSLAWSPDGTRIATSDSEGGVHVWDAGSRAKIWSGSTVRRWALMVAWSPDGTRVLAGVGRSVRLWNLDTPTPEQILRDHPAQVRAVGWSPDSTLIATADVALNVHLRNADTATPVRSLTGPASGAGAVLAWSPDGRTIATGSIDGPLRLWNAVTGELTATLSVA